MLQIQLIGRLGRDCEIRESQGKRFVSFAVAVDQSYKNAAGQKVERTEWVDCVANETGVTPYLLKGQQVFIEGDGKPETYTSKKDNTVCAKIKVRAHKIQLCGSKPDTGATAQPVQTAVPTPPPVTAPATPGRAALGGFDSTNSDDLPF